MWIVDSFFFFRYKHWSSFPHCLKSSDTFFRTVPWDLTLVADLRHIIVICMPWLDGHLFICVDQFTAWHLFIRPSWGCLHLTCGSLWLQSVRHQYGLRSKDSFLCSTWDLNWTSNNAFRYTVAWCDLQKD